MSIHRIATGWYHTRERKWKRRVHAHTLQAYRVQALQTRGGMALIASYVGKVSSISYIEPLRREVESVLNMDGTVDKRGFHKLVKLDSIMKESQRLNPLLLGPLYLQLHKTFSWLTRVS